MTAAATATAWMDTQWDPSRRLLRAPDDSAHMVRETAWYSVGLLSRGGPSPAEDLGVVVTRAADLLRIEYAPSPATLVLHLSAR